MKQWNFLSAAAVVAASLALTACAENPADSVPAASVAPAGGSAQTEPQSDANVATDGGAIDTAASDLSGFAGPDAAVPAASAQAIPLTGTIAVRASKVTRAHYLVFQEWTGTLDPGDGTPATAKLSFAVNTASIISDPDDRGMMSERLDTHLKSEDFFDAANHPTATFVSTSIVEGGEGGATHTVAGDLTVRGITKSITFPATVTIQDGTITAKAEFSLMRRDFNIVYDGKADDLVREEAVMTIDVQGKM